MDRPELLRDLEDRAAHAMTPCDDGDLVWHRWGTGPFVVLLHGGHGSWTHWIRTIGPLADRYTVLAVDLPGLGASAMPPEPASVASVVRIVADGLDRLLPVGGGYHLVGFSLGGALSGPLALADRARVRSVTLVGPGGLPAVRPHLELTRWRDEPDVSLRLAIHRHNLETLMFADPDAIDELAIRLQAQNAARGRLDGRSLSGGGILAEALPEISAPVAAIIGELDATIHPHMAERLALLRRLAPEIDVRVIPRAGHWVQYEMADEFNAHLGELLDRHANGLPAE